MALHGVAVRVADILRASVIVDARRTQIQTALSRFITAIESAGIAIIATDVLVMALHGVAVRVADILRANIAVIAGEAHVLTCASSIACIDGAGVPIVARSIHEDLIYTGGSFAIIVRTLIAIITIHQGAVIIDVTACFFAVGRVDHI
jgi:hypothetical protein